MDTVDRVLDYIEVDAENRHNYWYDHHRDHEHGAYIDFCDTCGTMVCAECSTQFSMQFISVFEGPHCYLCAIESGFYPKKLYLSLRVIEAHPKSRAKSARK